MFIQKKKVVISSLAILVLFVGFAANVRLGGAASTSDPAVPAVNTGTTFTYQGHLTDNGSPANGTYDFSFLLYDALVILNPRN